MLSVEFLRSLRIEHPEQIRPAAIRLRDAVETLCGMRTAVSHNIAVKDPMRDADGEVLASSVFGFVEDHDRWWLSPQLALHSPLTAACRFEAEPFWCNANGIYTRRSNSLVSTIDLANFGFRAMTAAAIVVPIHLPFGQVAAASFLPHDAGVEDLSEEYRLYADILAIYVAQFVISYVQTMRPEPFAVPDVSLTKREVECLRWAALGKTNDEIATILDLSRATVRFHIRNASTKLKAVNRDQTLFKAAQLGYLGMIV